MADNLSIPDLAAAQNQKEVTINAQKNQLSGALADYLAVDLSGGDHTLSASEFTSYMAFKTTGNAVSRTLTIPATKRALFYVENGGSATLSVTCGSTTFSVAAGAIGFFQTDGTTNGIITLTSSATGGEVDIGFVISGQPSNAQKILYKFNQAMKLVASLTGSEFTVGTNPTTNPITITLKKNGSSSGSIAVSSAGAFTPTFASDVSYAIGDIFEIDMPSPQDATAADFCLNFKFTKL